MSALAISTSLAVVPPLTERGSYGPGAAARSSYEAEVIRLRDELEDARATIAYLKDLISPPGLVFLPRWKLTEKEARLLRALLAAVSLSKEQLLAAMYDTEPEVEIKIVDVLICRIRNKVRGDGLEIETMWGTGYRVTAAMKAAFAEAAEAARQGLEWASPLKSRASPSARILKIAPPFSGAELRAQRLELNLSQESLRKLAGLPHAGYVSNVESGIGTQRSHDAVDKALRDERRKRCLPDPKPAG